RLRRLDALRDPLSRRAEGRVHGRRARAERARGRAWRGPLPSGLRSRLKHDVVSRHILSFAEYAAVRHPTPYLVEVERDGSHLALLGGLHSSDPANPMFVRIEAAFSRLSPMFALHEGTP